MRYLDLITEALAPTPTLYRTISFSDFAGENRRFLYNAQARRIIIGGASPPVDGGLNGSHAAEFGQVDRAPGSFDDYMRGWVGQGRGARNGVIHFAPAVLRGEASRAEYEEAYGLLKLFERGGFPAKCVVRGYGDIWEQPLSAALAYIPQMSRN